MHIYKNLVRLDDGQPGTLNIFCVDIYVSLVKVGVVNLGILRQKLHSPMVIEIPLEEIFWTEMKTILVVI